MNIGCVRLTERYLLHDPPGAEEVDAMVACIEELDDAVQALPVLSTLQGGVDSWAWPEASPPWPHLSSWSPGL